MAKSLVQIHQQTINILGLLRNRECTKANTIDKVIAIHNQYFDNVAEAYDAKGADFFGLQWNRPIQKSIYAKQV